MTGTLFVQRSRKRGLRLRPAEDQAIEALAKTFGVSYTDLLRGWVLAGLRGELHCEGVLLPASAPTEQRLTVPGAV